jgi:hypothetical protein
MRMIRKIYHLIVNEAVTIREQHRVSSAHFQTFRLASRRECLAIVFHFRLADDENCSPLLRLGHQDR